MSEDGWLDDVEQRAWVKFIAVVERLPGVLDTQLRRDADLTHFDYFTMAMLSEAPDRSRRMTDLAAVTNSTLPRLSHVVSRLEDRGYIERTRLEDDRRATNAHLTEAGWSKIRDTAPGHVGTVRENVIDVLSTRDVADLDRIMGKLLVKLDPEQRVRVKGEAESATMSGDTE